VLLAFFNRSVCEVLSGVGSGYFDSLVGLVSFLLIGRWFQTYSFACLNSDRDYRDFSSLPIVKYPLVFPNRLFRTS
jgi:Cu+-exporting ATPase